VWDRLAHVAQTLLNRVPLKPLLPLEDWMVAGPGASLQISCDLSRPANPGLWLVELKPDTATHRQGSAMDGHSRRGSWSSLIEKEYS